MFLESMNSTEKEEGSLSFERQSSLKGIGNGVNFSITFLRMKSTAFTRFDFPLPFAPYIPVTGSMLSR